MNIIVNPQKTLPIIDKAITDIKQISLPININPIGQSDKSAAMNAFINSYSALQDLICIIKESFVTDWRRIRMCVDSYIEVDARMANTIDGLRHNSMIEMLAFEANDVNPFLSDLSIVCPDFEVRSSNISEIKNNISSGINSLCEILEEYRNDISVFNLNPTFEGVGATRIKNYLLSTHGGIIDELVNIANNLITQLHNYQNEYINGLGERISFAYCKDELFQLAQQLPDISNEFDQTTSVAETTVVCSRGLPNFRGASIGFVSLWLHQERETYRNAINNAHNKITSLIDMIEAIENQYAVWASNDFRSEVETLIHAVNCTRMSINIVNGDFRINIFSGPINAAGSSNISELPRQDERDIVGYWLGRLIQDDGTINESLISECYNALVLEGIISGDVSLDVLRGYSDLHTYMASLGYSVVEIKEFFNYLIISTPLQLASMHVGRECDIQSLIAPLCMLETAYSYIGYRETPDNYTLFNEWYFQDNTSCPWCATFVSYCANEAGIMNVDIDSRYNDKGQFLGETIVSLPGYNSGRYRISAVVNIEQLYIDCDRFYYRTSNYVPSVGDFVTFRGSQSEHIGIVMGYDAQTDMLYTIEGNSGDEVRLHTYYDCRNNNYIYGYCDNRFESSVPFVLQNDLSSIDNGQTAETL